MDRYVTSTPAEINDKPTYPIGSVDSALRLLLMVGERGSVRIAEASDELNVARSTAHRMMQMLQYYDLVKQDPESKAYSAGPMLISLGLRVVRMLDVPGVARPRMEALATEVQETVVLMARQKGTDVICLESVESPRALRIGSRTGMVVQAHASASGRALLATLPEDEVLELYPSSRLPNPQPRSVTTRNQLLAQLEEVREAGYAVQRDESEPGVSAVAAPVRSGEGSASFVLTIMVPTSRLSDKDIPVIGAAAVREAGEVAAALSY
jgi:DNA-binding IclR family transcriptional regulator